MTEKIPEHYHCHICGKPITLGETLCSDECKQKYQSMNKKRRLLLYFIYAVLIGLFVVMLYFNR